MNKLALQKIEPIKLESIYNSNDEIEKHYTLKSNTQEEFDKVMSLIIQKLGLNKPICVKNIDVYYDEDDILRMYNITVRKRNTDLVYTLKYENDNDKLLERKEVYFESIEEVMNFLRNEFNIPINNLKEVITLNTSRIKYNLETSGSIIEVSFDTTTPVYNGESLDMNYMVELELKGRNTIGLVLLDKMIKEFECLEEINLSKKEIALRQVRTIDSINSLESIEKYKDKLKSIFIGSSELLERLQLLNEKKQEIRKIKEQKGSIKPIVITVSGTPRAGKTTCIDNLTEFFKKADLNTICLEEPAGLIYQKLKTREEKQKLLSDRVGFVKKQYEIGKNSIEECVGNNDIILCDRGYIDTFIWYDMYYKLGMMNEHDYNQFLSRMNEECNYLNYLYLLFSSSDESMKRDYFNSLSIEPRTTMNRENIGRYNRSLLRMYGELSNHLNVIRLIDTTQKSRIDASIMIANEVSDDIIKVYSRRK